MPGIRVDRLLASTAIALLLALPGAGSFAGSENGADASAAPRQESQADTPASIESAQKSSTDAPAATTKPQETAAPANNSAEQPAAEAKPAQPPARATQARGGRRHHPSGWWGSQAPSQG